MTDFVFNRLTQGHSSYIKQCQLVKNYGESTMEVLKNLATRF